MAGVFALAVLASICDKWGLTVFLMLTVVQLINVSFTHRALVAKMNSQSRETLLASDEQGGECISQDNLPGTKFTFMQMNKDDRHLSLSMVLLSVFSLAAFIMTFDKILVPVLT